MNKVCYCYNTRLRNVFVQLIGLHYIYCVLVSVGDTGHKKGLLEKAEKGQIEVVKLLLHYNADPDAKVSGHCSAPRPSAPLLSLSVSILGLPLNEELADTV